MVSTDIPGWPPPESSPQSDVATGTQVDEGGALQFADHDGEQWGVFERTLSLDLGVCGVHGQYGQRFGTVRGQGGVELFGDAPLVAWLGPAGLSG